jgi:hypothetical protein
LKFLGQRITATRALVVGLLVGLTIVSIFVPLNVYWNMDRINKFQRWNAGYQDAQLFAFYGMNQAEVQISSTKFDSNTTIQDWYSQDLQTAYFAMNLLSQTDSNLVHRTRFFYMGERLNQLEVNMSWTLALNDSQRGTLSKVLYSIGNDIL